MKRGFTLIELLAVIVVLAVIALVAIPAVLIIVDKAKDSAVERSIENIQQGAETFIKIQQIENPEYIFVESDYSFNGEQFGKGTDDPYIKIAANDENQIGVAIYKYNKCFYVLGGEADVQIDKNIDKQACLDMFRKPNYVDASGANVPVLSESMIPIRHDGSNWVVADLTEEWYDYDKQHWANVVITTEESREKYSNIDTVIDENDVLLYLVWIPRFKYTVPSGSGPREVSIIFETDKATTGTGNGNGDDAYYTHPAFNFDGTDRTGFWVAKFESGKYQGSDVTTWTSNGAKGYNSGDYMVSKANVYAWRGISVGQEFEITRNVESNPIYGINGAMNSHMSSSLEWGAVAYFSHSKYGFVGDIRFNNSNTFVTGCAATNAPNTTSSSTDSGYSGCENAYNTSIGVLASTTQNIYGVYDMSGGAYEHVAGYIDDYSSKGGISPKDYASYFDFYPAKKFGIIVTGIDSGLTGDAGQSDPTKGWYDDFGDDAKFNSTNSWLRRGGDYTYGKNCGIFSYNSANGGSSDYGTFRLIIIP